ncbi:MAG: hypothetical protein WBQ55_27695, partial [Xanthobacteraceae bacterium]
MVVKSALKTEMPTLEPMLRERLKMLAPSARSFGESVDKVTALIGTKRTPKPAPCTNPVTIISCAETSGVHPVMSWNAHAEKPRPMARSKRVSTFPTNLPTIIVPIIVPR